ncbi:putative anthranilate synthase component II [Mycobacterium xenopi 3993]|nr:putative anthranilate synthase component II [Mycobacterium xenopi 3993]
MRILVVDNYDSFVFNLVQYLGQLGVEAQVWRNDDARLSDQAAVAAQFDGCCSARVRAHRSARGVDRSGAGLRRRAHPAAGRVLRASGDRGGVWGHRRPRTRTLARQNQQCISHECWCAARTSGSFHRDPVSLADDPAGDLTARAGGDGPDSQRGDHGCAARRTADPRGAVSSRVHSHRGRAPDVSQLACLLRATLRRRPGAAAGKRDPKNDSHGAAARGY